MTASIISPEMKKLGRKLIALVFWIIVWQIAAAAVGQELLIPAPRLVLSRLITLGGTALFWQSAVYTLARIFIGFVCGTVVGALLAVATYAFRLADVLLAPAIRVVRATPVASFIVLMLLWVQTGQVPTVISALMVIPVIWGNVVKGIAETDPLLLEMGQAYEFGWWKQKRLLYFPSVLPYFASGCTTALGLAWKAGVAAEVLCLPKQAVGTQVYFSKIYLETPSLFAWTLVIIVMSFLVEGVMNFGIRRLSGRYEKLRGGGA